MAYDEVLAARIRALTADEPGLAEKRMFGGLAFLVDGRMAVAASGHGGVMVRVGADAAADLLASTPAEPVTMRGRPMTGWLRVGAAHVADDADLAEWVRRGVAFARSLPAEG
jgi:TfoX/Sxy family transcriptional regulator of competence genes